MAGFRDQVDGYRPDARRLKEQRDAQQAKVAEAALAAAKDAEHSDAIRKKEALELGKQMVQYLKEHNVPSIPVKEKGPAIPEKRSLFRKQTPKIERRAWVVFKHKIYPTPITEEFDSYLYGGLIDDGEYFLDKVTGFPNDQIWRSRYDAGHSISNPATALHHLRSQEFMQAMAWLVETGEFWNNTPRVAFPVYS